jgi:hypothetical protein
MVGAAVEGGEVEPDHRGHPGLELRLRLNEVDEADRIERGGIQLALPEGESRGIGFPAEEVAIDLHHQQPVAGEDIVVLDRRILPFGNFYRVRDAVVVGICPRSPRMEAPDIMATSAIMATSSALRRNGEMPPHIREKRAVNAGKNELPGNRADTPLRGTALGTFRRIMHGIGRYANRPDRSQRPAAAPAFRRRFPSSAPRPACRPSRATPPDTP